MFDEVHTGKASANNQQTGQVGSGQANGLIGVSHSCDGHDCDTINKIKHCHARQAAGAVSNNKPNR